MTEQEAEKKVQECNTLLDLANVIREIGSVTEYIQGRTKSFNSEKMAQMCESYINYPSNVLTRNYGIRDKALELLTSNK